MLLLYIFGLIAQIQAEFVANATLVGRGKSVFVRLSGTPQDIRIRGDGLIPDKTYFLYLSEAKPTCSLSDTVTSTDFSTSQGSVNFSLKVATTVEALVGLRIVVWSGPDEVLCGLVEGRLPPPPSAAPPPAALAAIPKSTTTALPKPQPTVTLDNPNLLPPGYIPGQKLKVEDANLPPIDPNYINPAIRDPRNQVSEARRVESRIWVVVISSFFIAIF